MLNIVDESNNPALGSLLREMRHKDRQVGRANFRRNMRLVGTLLAYELAKTLAGTTETTPTPLGDRDLTVLAKQPVLATALRAGLPLLDGMMEIFPECDTTFFGAARIEGNAPADDGSMEIELGYSALSLCEGRELIFVDPMIATGSTVIDIYKLLESRGQSPARFIVAGLVGWRGAYDRIRAEVPAAEVWFATCDEELNEQGYIVPGLGDAGDLCFGPKL